MACRIQTAAPRHPDFKLAMMRIALIADAFPPLRSSGAVQLRDLSRELARQGHAVSVFTPAPDQSEQFRLDYWEDVRIVRLKSPRTKDVGYLRRTFAELLMPFAMLRGLRRSPLATETWDGVVWYSPSIFLGPMAAALKRRSRCRSYLIVRDIFPQWAVDMGLMGRGLPYLFFKLIERYQYSVADVIGVQTPGNLPYLAQWVTGGKHRRIDVLQNWLTPAPDTGCSISIGRSSLAGRRIFVYAGNMGIAQGMGILLELAAALQARKDVGFIFVGRGSDSQRLRHAAGERSLDNVLFFDEIDPDEIPGLYAQCDAGVVALDPRHRTHNIPGKFLSYMHNGLPVLAVVNRGNDLVDLIETEQVGEVVVDGSIADLASAAVALIDDVRDRKTAFNNRCKILAARLFSSEAAVHQVLAGLDPFQGLGRNATSTRWTSQHIIAEATGDACKLESTDRN